MSKTTLCILIGLIGILPLQVSAQPLAQGQKKFVGNIISNGFAIRPDFTQYWNQVVPENAGKWGSVETSAGNYNWANLDNTYNFAIGQGYPYKHHNLIWGQQQPSFLGGLDSASQYTEVVNWIANSGVRYPNASFCDVVNEPLHAPPSYKNALGGDGTTGWDWVITAFQLAKNFWASKTKLHLNEYSVINDRSANTQFLTIINLLKTRHLIDGIGVQGHNFEVNGGASVATLQANLDNLAATGLPIYITEFDINTSSDSVQLLRYQQIFPVLYNHRGVAGITLWGYAQNEIWQVDAYLLRTGGTERPAMKWLRKYLATPIAPIPVSPISTTDEPRNVRLTWHPAALATSYRVQIATDTLFSTVVVDSMVIDTVKLFAPLAADTKFFWHVSAANDSGVSPYSLASGFTTGNLVVAVSDVPQTPVGFSLSQNYPNPFNPSTTIEFTLPARSNVRLLLINILGQVVQEVASGIFAPGIHTATIDGSHLSSGVYFCRMEAGNFVGIKKVVLLK
jgi:endo-1,4-beta-xylanase